MNKSIPQSGYYFYVITENGVPCYIGKGKKDRVLSHFKGTTNSIIKNKIKLGKDYYDWYIDSSFEHEVLALEREKELITECKTRGIKLYNTVHYTNRAVNWTLVRSIFRLFKTFENYLFPIDGIGINSKERIKITQEAIDIVLSQKQIEMPVYEGISLDKLGLRIAIESNKERIQIYER